MAYNAAGEGDLDRVFFTNHDLIDQFVGEKVYSWGYNNYGQLGDGTTSSRLSPTQVSGGGATWTKITNSPSDTVFGIKSDGTMWSWGYTGEGVAAGGGGSSPVTVSGGGTNWVSVSTSYKNGSAIKSDGTLWVWGRNNNGEVGDGTVGVNRSSPVSIAGGGTNWKYCSSGGYDGAGSAIKTDSTLWTWGENRYGQNGDWTFTGSYKSSPAVVVGPPALKDASSFRKDIKLSATTAPVKSNFKKFDNETMYFDGSGYLTVPCTTNSTPYGTENWTIEFWMYATSAGSYGIMELPGSVSLGMVNGIAPMVMWNGIQANGIGYYNNVFQNRWVHLAAVKNGTTFTFYVNGQPNATTTIASTNFPTSDITIGYASQMGNFYGYLDQVRIIKGVAKYTAAFTPSLYPMFDPISADPYYSNVSLLLKADDVANAANNNTFVDNSGNNFAITRNGNTTQGSFSPFAVEPGKWSNYFDGWGDWLSSPSSSNIVTGTNNATIECWFNWTGSGTYFQFCSSSTTNLNFYATVGAISFFNGTSSVTVTASIQKNTWNHFAVSRTGTTGSAFINGVLLGTFAWSNDYSTSMSVNIGSNANSGSGYEANGYISNFRIVNGTALYTSNFTPSTVPLTAVAGTSLLTCQDNRFVDNSINNFALTPTGDVKPVPTSPFSKNTDILAPYFNGSTDSLTITSTTNLTLSGDFTVECWFNKVSGGGNGCIFDIWPMRIFTNGTSVEVWEGASRNFYAQNSILFNNWNHIAIVRSGTTITAYLNGTSFGSYTSSTSFNGNVVIAYEDSQALNGYVSDFRIVKGTAVYTSNFTPSTQPLKAIANTSLLTCQSDTVDNSSNRYTVTKGGSVNVMPVVPYESPTGDSVYFDGSGDYLTVGSTSVCDFGTNDFTVEFFANFSSVTNCHLFDTRPAGTDGAYMVIYTDGSGILYFNTNAGNRITGSALSTKQWYHISVSRTSGNTKMFVNGTQVGSTYSDSTSYLNPANRPFIAGSGYANSGSFYGYISNLRVTKGVALYTGNFKPSSINLGPSANTSLLTCQDKTIKDNSTNNSTITAAGDAKPARFGPFKPSDYYFGGSMYFDGTGDYLTPPSVITAAGNFTVEFWALRLTDISSYQIVTCNNTNSFIGWQTNGSQFYIGDTSGGASIAIPETKNQWTHISVVKSGTTMTLYWDGVSKGTYTSTSSFSINGIGCYGVGGSPMFYFNGYLSNLRFVNGTALYTANFTPPTKPALPVTNTSLLLSGTNAGIVDSTGRYNVETMGNTQISTNYRKWNTGSIYFDGSSYLKFPSITFAGDYTLEAWVYPTNENLSQQIFSSTASNTQFVINLTYLGSVGSAINGGVVINASGSAVKTNQWNHIAWVREGSVSKVFVNGILQGTGGAGGSFSLDVMGFWGAGGGYYVNGYIDDIRITNGVARYTKNFSVTTKPLAKIDSGATSTSLLTCQSSTIVDNSNNAFAITTVGNTAVSTFAPFVGTNSVYFDGSSSMQTNSSVPAMTSDFTVEFFVYLTSLPLFNWPATIVSISMSNYIGVKTDRVSVVYDNSTYGEWAYTFATSTWYHIAITRQSGTVYCYINGIKITLTGGSNLTTSSFFGSPLFFSKMVGSGNPYPLTGYLSNLRVVKGQALYTSNFTLSDVPFPPVRSLPARYVAPDANYSSVGMQMNPNEIVNLDYSSGWKQSSIGQSFLIAVKNDGTLWGCGDNSYSQMGPFGNAQKSIMTSSTYGSNWKQVSAGYRHAAAIKTDGTLWMWGENTYGQIGDGTTSRRSSPVTTAIGGTNWKSVSCGVYHTVAIKTDGTVWTWGYNSYGQIGDGTTTDRLIPTIVTQGYTKNWKTASAGWYHTVAIAQD